MKSYGLLKLIFWGAVTVALLCFVGELALTVHNFGNSLQKEIYMILFLGMAVATILLFGFFLIWALYTAYKEEYEEWAIRDMHENEDD